MRAPVLAAGDGALGFWSALRAVSRRPASSVAGSTRFECSRRAAEVGAPGEGARRIWNAEDKSHPRDAVKQFESTYGAKFPKAVAKITDDVEQLLAFYDYPAEHWCI